jgi:2-keto-4-pentenoate hydratase
MTPKAIDEAVQHLLRARREMTRLPGLPASCRPQTPADGYAIQEAFIAAWGQPLAGWKVGCTSQVAQAMLGVDEPFYGPVFAPLLHHSPAVLPAADFHMLALECEFAFRLAYDLPAEGAPYDRDKVMAAVDALLPAIEVISSRVGDLATAGGPQVIADCGVNGALVVGEARADWQGLRLDEHRVRIAIDGEGRGEGTGAAVLGHPLNALIWFVNRRAEHGRGLLAGEVVTTGTCTGLTPVAPGQSAVADYGELGRIELRFTP